MLLRHCTASLRPSAPSKGLQELDQGFAAALTTFALLSWKSGWLLHWLMWTHPVLMHTTYCCCMGVASCRLPPVLLGSVMRRSCRLSTKQEHKLVKKAEASAALAAAAEAAIEGTSVYPSSVTKAIAGLATPSLPSPSMFPEDWRMVEELLHDGQVSRAVMLQYNAVNACQVISNKHNTKHVLYMLDTLCIAVCSQPQAIQLVLQGNDVQAQALCPTKLFANLDAEPTSCADDQCPSASARLGSTGMLASAAMHVS